MWNNEKRIQGHTDIALDDVGIMQSQKLGMRLANETIDTIYTSDLQRASQTAKIINSFVNAKLVESAALREISFGIFEGRVYHEIAEELDNYRNTNRPVPGGEDINEYFAKVQAYVKDVVAGHDGNIMFVGHHGTVRAAICYFMETPTEERGLYRIDNTSLHCFEKTAEGYYVMTIDNDTGHLGDGVG